MKKKRSVNYRVQPEVVTTAAEIVKLRRHARLYPRPKKSAYREQFGVIVICQNANDQAKLYRQLKRRYPAREIKVVCT